MTSISPSLWFATDAEEAAQFYTSAFGGRILRTTRYRADTPSNLPVGDVLTVDIELFGTTLTLLNGGDRQEYTDALSLQVPCDSQEESDRFWAALLEGGSGIACGWIQDRYGVRWQIFPAELGELVDDPDPERARRATEAMLKQVRIDLAEIRAAADGAGG